MKITRTINGSKYNIELLPGELLDAYNEQRDKFDIEDVVSYVEEIPLDELEVCYGCTYPQIMQHKEEIAKKMRRYMNECDMRFSDARDYAIDDVMKRNKVVC